MDVTQCDWVHSVSISILAISLYLHSHTRTHALVTRMHTHPARTCTHLHGPARICTDLHASARTCTDLHGLARILIHILPRTCTYLNNYLPAPIFYLHAPISDLYQSAMRLTNYPISDVCNVSHFCR